MSAISDFAAKQNAFNDQIGASIDGLAGDITTLNDKIQALQDSLNNGNISAADQALLDDLVAHGQTLADKAAALDAMTPPAPPQG